MSLAHSPFRRILRSGAFVLTIASAVALTVFSVRSFFFLERFTLSRVRDHENDSAKPVVTRNGIELTAIRGSIGVGVARIDYYSRKFTPSTPRGWRVSHRIGSRNPNVKLVGAYSSFGPEWMGFRHVSYAQPPHPVIADFGIYEETILIPSILPILVQLAWPIVRSVRWWRTRGPRAEFACKHCGYDLRATPDRCPECGMLAQSLIAR